MNLLKNDYIIVTMLLLLWGTGFSLQAQETTILSVAEWSHEPVAGGITLHRAAFEGNLFGANQYLCVLEVAPGARFDIVPAAEKTLELTSEIAARSGAVAAVNGSFFNMRAPYGSVNYLRVDGQELAPNAYDSYENRRRGRSTRQSGAVVTFKDGLYVVKSDDLARWEQDIAAEDVVTTGPMLLIGGQAEAVVADNFNRNRHPRTAVGRRTDGTVLLVVADGRNSQAAGLSMLELQQVMAALGCCDAVNLDGGGSTAMVVRGKVVNHPSDNKRFDAEGERRVANAICVSLPQ
ncbi:MAG: phosphodiester glycosidase family protein [Bacteroidales bacterium]|nr:phosphodiester glycosidase family protein [Bacteroidales bacterium]